MIHPFLTKLKITCKRYLGQCVYNLTYFKHKLQSLSVTNLFSSTSRTNLIAFTIKRWKSCGLIFFIILSTYYGLGAIISSKIDNRLNQPIKISAPLGHHGIASLELALKTQIDTNAWVPSLPAIFPAAVLDNLSNFQLGTKEAITYYIKRYAELYQNSHLNEAQTLLNYPPHIWLFSQTKDDTFAPGSAKQYRKAIAQIETFIANDAPHLPSNITTFLYIIKNVNHLLSKYISKINTYTQEHTSDYLTLKADDLFYQTQGIAYATHYLLTGLIKDYQSQIVDNEQYENMTLALKSLADAVKLNPMLIKSAAPNDSYAANHLIYIAYHLLQAQNYLLQVYYSLSHLNMEPQL